MSKNKFNNLFWRISAVFFVLLAFIGLSYIFITVHYSNRYFQEVNQLLNKNIAAHSTPFTAGKVNEHAFLASQDPTTLNRQGNDSGTQYRSVAFYRNEKEKQIITEEINRLTNSKKYNSKIVTEVMPFKKFYSAEEHHSEK